MILVLDNYDSFTYNLVQYLQELAGPVEVLQNDTQPLDALDRLDPARIVIAPGPGAPAGAGIALQLVRRWAGRRPLLGVCLGHQVIARAFGGSVGRAPVPVHGKTSPVHHDGRTIFAGLSQPFAAMRYHSLIVESNDFPSCLEVSARTDDGLIMGLRHREYPVEGVQFHPESILTTEGKKLLANFLRL
ncbi:MAG: aminodeoxychorismate/anthranilate synthase component II [Candidatus Latescibacteria bacterium]|nr:aminodeoxychorismate/anthranilate synthase component II [Candidatus Latescibacterota bacterium]